MTVTVNSTSARNSYYIRSSPEWCLVMVSQGWLPVYVLLWSLNSLMGVSMIMTRGDRSGGVQGRGFTCYPWSLDGLVSDVKIMTMRGLK